MVYGKTPLQRTGDALINKYEGSATENGQKNIFFQSFSVD